MLKGDMRGLSICRNTSCPRKGKGTFLPNEKAAIKYAFCDSCGKKRLTQMEKVESTDSKVYRKVTVHFAFNWISMEYKSAAVIVDDSIYEGGEITYYTPLISHAFESKALKMAEAIYASMNTSGHLNTDPMYLHLDADKDEFNRQINILRKVWDAVERRLQ